VIRADRIVLYKSVPCGFCSAAIRFLQEFKGEAIEIVDVTADRDARMALIQMSGRRTVPQIWVGETHVGGYDDLRALDASGGLDPLIAAVQAAREA